MTDEELYEIVKKAYQDANRQYLIDQVKDACRYCPNNPQNGGSGVCHCVLGQAVIY